MRHATDLHSPKPFHVLAEEVVAEKTGPGSGLGSKLLAEEVGVSYLTFRRWLQGERPIHADKLSTLCKKLDDYRLLDWLELQVGRVAFRLPEIKEPADIEDVKAIQKLVKEVGEALQAMANTLEDHIVENWEVEKTVPELDDVIRECVRLKHWLAERAVADKEKKRGTKRDQG